MLNVMANYKTIIMKLLCFIFFISLSPFLKGQITYAPLNAYWNYSYVSHDGGERSNLTFQVTKDTLVSGTLIKEITVVEDLYFSLSQNRPVGMYTYRYADIQYRNDSVFYDDGFNIYYLYNFTMQTDDTLTIIPSFPNLIAIVDSVYSIVINGDTLQNWALSEYCESVFWKNVNIVEGIGPIDDFIYWNTDGCVIGGLTYNFECFHSSSINYNSPCLPITLNIESDITADNFVTLYPLPAKEFISIQLNHPLDDVQIRIFDIYSQIISKQYFRNLSNVQIDLSTIKSGYYFISLETPKTKQVNKFYKIE